MAKVTLEEALSYVSQQAGNYGVDANHAQAILLAENMGPNGEIPPVIDTDKVSPKGATGIMQVMPTTKTALVSQGYLDEEHAESSDWRGSINAGLATLKEIQKRTKTTDPRILAAEYNAGPKGGKLVSEGSIDQLPLETINYLKNFDFAQGWLQGLPKGAEGVATPTRTTTATRTANGSGVRTRSVTAVSGMEAIEEMLKNNSIFVDQAIRMITDSTEAEIAAHNQAAKQAEAAGESAANAERIKGTIDAAAAQSRERVLKILNLDTRDADNIVSQKTVEFMELDAARRKAAAVIDDKLKVGFFDNPIEFIINATQLPGMVEEHNSIVRRQNDSIQILRTTQGIASEQERIDVAATADQLAQFGLARGNAVAAEANARAAQLKAQSASASARMVTTIAGLQERRLDNALKVAQWNKVVDSYREGDTKKGKELEEEQQLDRDLRRIGALVGAPSMSLQVLKRMTKKEQQEWLDRVAANNIGNNLYEAITFIKPGMLTNMKNSGSAALAEAVSNFQKVTFQNASLEGARLQMQGAKIPPRDELLRQAASNLEGEFFATSNNMLLARPYNPYIANHTVMATQWKGDPNNVVANIVRDGVKNRIRFNDQQIFSALTKMVSDGTILPKVAAQQLSDYYAAVIERNNRAYSYSLLGLPNQEDYKILPKEAKKGVNLVAPGELENIFTKVAARAKSATSGFFIPEGMTLVPYPSGYGGMLMKEDAAEEYLKTQAAKRKESEKNKTSTTATEAK